MDYDSYYLEYLNRYNIVELYSPGNTEYSEFIDSMIEMFTSEFGTLFQRLSQLRKISPPVIHTKCILNDKINAFCFWHPEQNFYGVAIHSATYNKLYNQLSTFAHDPKIKDIAYLNTFSSDELTKYLYIYAIQFIGKHEYMHIILGHCRLIHNKRMGLYMEEHSMTSKSAQKNLYFQAMERLADIYAVKDSIVQILYLSNYEIEKIKTNLLIYYLSILHIFSLFYAGEHYNWESSNILDDLLSSDHPVTSMRFYYIAEAIDESLLNHYKKESYDHATDIVDYIDHIMDIIFKISRLFSDSFQIELIYPIYSEPGTRYNVRLFNAMPPVISDCESVAMFHPVNYVPIDENIAVQEIQDKIKTLM